MKCDELKWKWAYFPYLDDPEEQHESAVNAGYVKVLLKAEADKVIAHEKYKQCLAMAKICENKLGTIVKPGWWVKWYKRWLALAEHYKEAK